MRENLAEWLVDPRNGSSLELESTGPDDLGEVTGGAFVAADGSRFQLRAGIPDFVAEAAGRSQTSESFAWKWAGWDEVETPGGYDAYRSWFIERHFDDEETMLSFVRGRSRVLDAGCGSGLSASVYLGGGFHGEAWIGADISEAVLGAKKRVGNLDNTHFVRADMLHLPLREGAFDTVIAEGTLHHTPSTRQALGAVVRHLEPGGLILFYVYRRKSVIREFTDDLIRERISELPPGEAMELVTPLTELGKALAGLNQEVEIPDIPVLGITAGTYDIQRFFYWHVAKAFWNDSYSFDENDHINFDWYHPRYAHRHTAEEIRCWCAELGLEVERFFEEEAGFSVRARLST